MINAIYQSIKIPQYIMDRSDSINEKLSTISLIGLSALAFYLRPQQFMVAAGTGALWQVGVAVLKQERLKTEACESKMGCVDGYLRWFIGEVPLSFEKIVGGTWLAAEHMVHHNKYITFANFLSVSMGIRVTLFVQSFFAAKGSPASADKDAKACHTDLTPHMHHMHRTKQA